MQAKLSKQQNRRIVYKNEKLKGTIIYTDTVIQVFYKVTKLPKRLILMSF